MANKAEFYETAVRSGFYGIDRSGLVGKKDNVRKFWEDMSIKLHLQPIVGQIRREKGRLRVVDLGSGSGEGFELLTHLPPHADLSDAGDEFLLSVDDFESYVGLDLSPGMVLQGRENYRNLPIVEFREADLSKGFPLTNEAPFDLYFSSYGSQSHLDRAQLKTLIADIALHVADRGYMVFDLLGRLSPEWPRYWSKTCEKFLPYNMAYLLPAEDRVDTKIEWFKNSFWSADELVALCAEVAGETGRRIEIVTIKDRSIFVGRHIETGLFGGKAQPLRHQVNRLLDHGYRGQIDALRVDVGAVLAGTENHPKLRRRLESYGTLWNTVIDALEALMTKDDPGFRRLLETADPTIAEDLKMLAWLCRNRNRFTVADFWASVIGPQVAVVLRSIEMGLDDAVGCGHGLFAVARISDPRFVGTPGPSID